MIDATMDDDATSILPPPSHGALGVLAPDVDFRAHTRTNAEWLIDNAVTYDRVLEALHGARRSIRIAQLAFDFDCLACASEACTASRSHGVVLAEMLIAHAKREAPEMQILLNASWLLNTARPLRRAFARRGIPSDRIQVRGFNKFPHFMHAKLVLVDGRDAFLLGSPFVNSYWDDTRHVPFDARRPLRELGGRPLHDVSIHLRGPAIGDLEAMYANVWKFVGAGREAGRTRRPLSVTRTKTNREAGTRIVCDAPDGVRPELAEGSMMMLGELLEAIARARSFIYIEHQYLTSRPIVAALAAALSRAPALEIIIVLNQNPDLTAYRGWQNARLAEHGLLVHPRVGVFTLWAVDEDPTRAGVARINQLFIHSKVIVIDDTWAAVGTSNLDGVSMGDYGDDFSGALGRRVFRGVRNVEVNVVIDSAGEAEAGAPDAAAIVSLRERLWEEHLGVARAQLPRLATGKGLAAWRKVAHENVRMLSGAGVAGPSAPSRRAGGHVLPYSECAFPREQLEDLEIQLSADELVLCYDPSSFEVHAAVH